MRASSSAGRGRPGRTTAAGTERTSSAAPGRDTVVGLPGSTLMRLAGVLLASGVLVLGGSLPLSGSLAPAGGTGSPPSPTTTLTQEAYDLVLSGGRIVDGSGDPWYRGDVAIRGDRIARIAPPGRLADADAGRRIDAGGMVVAPGFIDIQSHSRYAFLAGDGRVISKVTQGITTEIMGEGSTNAPGPDFNGPRGFDAWLRAMEEHGASPNFGSFLGASSVRNWVMGMAQGEPDEARLQQMRALVKNAMLDGAFGIATALIYPPGNFATTAELVEMSRVMAPYGGVYITHMRSEADDLLGAIDEAIEIGREGGVPVEIFHLKAAGRRNWFKAPLAIARIDAARAEGLDVQANMYPYTAGSTGLTACLPPWSSADGALLDNLRDPESRQRIEDEIRRQQTAWENLCSLAGPEGVLILGFRTEANRRYTGMYLSEIAADMGVDWVDALIDIVVAEEGGPGTIYFLMSEENVELQLAQPWIKFGTDASGADPEGARGLTHPRAYGTFPRILGRYVRERRVLSLEEAVRKASSAVATRLSIRDRGMLQEGWFADVVVFDPETVGDRATYEQPHQVSAGVEWVLVNGTVVVEGGEHTGALPGRIVRGPGYPDVGRESQAGPGRSAARIP